MGNVSTPIRYVSDATLRQGTLCLSEIADRGSVASATREAVLRRPVAMNAGQGGADDGPLQNAFQHHLPAISANIRKGAAALATVGHSKKPDPRQSRSLAALPAHDLEHLSERGVRESAARIDDVRVR